MCNIINGIVIIVFLLSGLDAFSAEVKHQVKRVFLDRESDTGTTNDKIVIVSVDDYYIMGLIGDLKEKTYKVEIAIYNPKGDFIFSTRLVRKPFVGGYFLKEKPKWGYEFILTKLYEKTTTVIWSDKYIEYRLYFLTQAEYDMRKKNKKIQF